jgi:type I restriction enzyme S subunit
VGLFKNLNENILNYGFLTQFIFSNFFYKQLKSVLVAGAQPNISSKDIEGITFFLPKDIKEQEKISSFFGSIDDLIKLKQKEIERVDNYKKSLIQNLFI